MPPTDGITQNPTNSVNPSLSTTPITKDEFRQKYWFNTLQMVTLVNPLEEPFNFMVEMRPFIIQAGKSERFPGVIANVYLDQMSKILAQNDDRLGFMADPNLIRIYYDRLIVDVENLVPQMDTTPAYLKGMPASTIPKPEERAPWSSELGERATDVAPNAAPPMPSFPDVAPPQPPAPVAPAEPKTTEFEYEDAKYKMVVDKNGGEMFYKNGRLTSASEYAKAASMI